MENFHDFAGQRQGTRFPTLAENVQLHIGQFQIFDLKRQDIGILVTDHNVSETLAVTDRAYIINNGEIFRAGAPEALARDPEVRRVYLGDTFTLRV